MLCGTIVQTIVLLVMVYRANWNKEVTLALSIATAYEVIDGQKIKSNY